MEAVPPINKCSGTDELASWFCSECDISGKGFETCFRHLKSHALEEEEAIDATLSECHERYNEVVVDGVPDSLDYHLEQQWKETLAEHFGHVHIVATPSVCHERHYKEVVEAGVEEASLDSHPENATTMVKKQQ